LELTRRSRSLRRRKRRRWRMISSMTDHSSAPSAAPPYSSGMALRDRSIFCLTIRNNSGQWIRIDSIRIQAKTELSKIIFLSNFLKSKFEVKKYSSKFLKSRQCYFLQVRCKKFEEKITKQYIFHFIYLIFLPLDPDPQSH
jgi:hypothetical protein